MNRHRLAGSKRLQRPRNFTAWTAVFWAVVLTVVAMVAAWNRRWISDDGLIVLRTVRNLMAGNGPVFNMGERVETNTSALWQYSIYLFAELTSADLEAVALWMALAFTGLAVVLGCLASGWLYRSRGLILAPLGMLVYLAVPAARDFATSGLEWGLSIFWLSVLWLLLVLWVRGARGNGFIYGLAFWAGVSWLVRPELVLYGAVAGLIIVIAARSWAQRALILAVAIPLPLAYQIFRMGYYGSIVPQTAVAKSASESLWGRGWEYVLNFVDPYGFWWVVGALVLVGAVLVWAAVRSGSSVSSSLSDANLKRSARLQTPATAVIIMVVCALLHFTYVIRVGGDFMHARMLLIPLFAILLPVALVPLTDVRKGFEGKSDSRAVQWIQPVVVGAGVVFAAGWAINAVNNPVAFSTDDVDNKGEIHVVDERSFWMHMTDTSPQDPPLYAHQYMNMDLMHGYTEANDKCAEQREGNPNSDEARQCSGVLLSIGAVGPHKEDDWIPIGAVSLTPEGQPVIPGPVDGFKDLQYHHTTVSFLNLGMTSMMAPLDVRVVDPMGLANPLAARMPQIENGRPGHDKSLPLEWQMADTAVHAPYLPNYIDQQEVLKIRSILYTEDFVQLFHSYRAPMDAHRFWENIKFSLTEGRTMKFSDDIDDYEGIEPEQNVQIVWPADQVK